MTTVDTKTRSAQFETSPSFDFSSLTIPSGEIRAGGVPKDGIPALTNPQTTEPSDASYLKPEDRVVGLLLGKQARAYPLKILNYHEVVNDRCGNIPVAVTYCPLCDSVVAFDRRTELGEREFGVSGFLYNSNVLMYDRGGRPESLWSQLMAQGVSGPAGGKPLKTLPTELTTWQDWLERHPATDVLSDRTGYPCFYQVDPFRRCFGSRRLIFPARPVSDCLPTKAKVLGVRSAGNARAYPLSAFGETGPSLEQELDGHKFTLRYHPEAESLRVVDAEEGLQWMYCFWFAWYAFHRWTETFQVSG